MSKEQLLLPSARAAVLVSRSTPSPWWRYGALILGALVVVVGAADVTARAAHRVLGENTNIFAFAPVAVLLDPSLLDSDTSPANNTPLVPVQMRIASIGVNAKVESVGKKSDGAMATPSSFATIAWYAPGAKPGGSGRAVFAGHVNNALTTTGVFEHLSQIKLGDTIEVADKTGKILTFIVKDIQTYPADTAPAEEIFTTSGPSEIALVTCDGEWDSLAHSFDRRLIVVAQLKAS